MASIALLTGLAISALTTFLVSCNRVAGNFPCLCTRFVIIRVDVTDTTGAGRVTLFRVAHAGHASH